MVTLTFVTLEIDLTQETLGIADPGTIAETTSVVVAVIAETFQWVGYADMRGFVFYRDGTLKKQGQEANAFAITTTMKKKLA